MKQKTPKPPKFANRLLAWFCRAELLPEIQGDLHELYVRWVKRYGLRKAQALYFFNILFFFRLFAIKRKGYVLPITSRAMLRNYFLTAWRQVQKSKLHTAINVFGLAVGIAACLVIALTVQHEFSYDRHHPDLERIYRVTTHTKFTDEWFPNGGIPAPVPQAIREDFSGWEALTAAHTVHTTNVKLPDDSSLGEQKHIVIAEPDYFKVLSGYQWKIGNPEQSLTKPYQVVLTESQANKYFGHQEAVGKTVVYFDSIDFVVSGILEDNSSNTDLPFTDYLSYTTLYSNEQLAGNYGLESWRSTNSSSLAFLKLSEETSPQDIEQKFPLLIEKYMMKEGDDTTWKFGLQPLTEMHFDADYRLDQQQIAHKPTLYGLALVALFLLLIASVNFINLETARSVLRSREVGVRKVLGSSRVQLVQQFLGETFLITLLSAVLAILVAKLGMNYFAESLPTDLSLSVLWKGQGWLALLTIIIVVSFLAGTYPAWVLSAYSPVSALKSQVVRTSRATRKAYFRKALIIFQFAVAQAFILGTLIIDSQLHYLLNKDMGFKKDAVIHYRPENWWRDTTENRFLVANELRTLSSVSAVSLSGRLPASTGWSTRTVSYVDDTIKTEVSITIKEADTSFLRVYGIDLLAGRNYFPSDTTNELLLNETAVKAFGFEHPNDAVGELIRINENKELPVVGIVRDFHDGPLHKKISPVMMGSNRHNSGSTSILLATKGKDASDVQYALAQIEEIYSKFYPDQSLNYEFYDETIANFYATEQRTAKLINVTTGLAIFISCLGLLGLVSFATHQRVKEIGIRKVLGATVAQLIALFSQEFVKLVLISFIIAAPLAWYFAQEWLAGFAYRTDLGVFTFLLTILSALGLALLTVGLRSWRAAMANPADSLRNE
ncbi:ABC transporter permease [Tunicatimonas pelagia]|uniref:ABC transporter permease n=1 Tax=Tunicatimonas pelagia TaxID=931531 RepID=UPI002665CD3D|nr:ABC transporter permease [Tunicatimonas pelagia]WKN41143.1 ABC transporter permease [Tunicatimonas pelagia]